MEYDNRQAAPDGEDMRIIFPEGLFGFEEYHTFIPFSIEEDNEAMFFLQSEEEAHLSFIIMDPFLLKADYCPHLSDADKKALGVSEEEELSYYVLCVTKEPAEESTVNLKCPIVINAATRQARQVVLDAEEYGLRHPLKEFSSKEGA